MPRDSSTKLESALDSVEVLQDTHDNLNGNANLQVGDTDVSNGNPVPVVPRKVSTATVGSAVPLNDTVSTTVLSSNAGRISAQFGNTTNRLIWIKKQTAATDNDKKGIPLWPRSTSDIFINYTGEWSAIADAGTPDIYPTET